MIPEEEHASSSALRACSSCFLGVGGVGGKSGVGQRCSVAHRPAQWCTPSGLGERLLGPSPPIHSTNTTTPTPEDY